MKNHGRFSGDFFDFFDFCYWLPLLVAILCTDQCVMEITIKCFPREDGYR